MLKYIERGHECTRFKKPNHMIHYFNMLHTKSRLPSLSQNIQLANTWESQNVSGFLVITGPSLYIFSQHMCKEGRGLDMPKHVAWWWYWAAVERVKIEFNGIAYIAFMLNFWYDYSASMDPYQDQFRYGTSLIICLNVLYRVGPDRFWIANEKNAVQTLKWACNWILVTIVIIPDVLVTNLSQSSINHV